MSIPFLIIFKIFLFSFVVRCGIIVSKGVMNMAVSDKVKAILNIKGKRQKEVADYFEISEQAFRNKLTRGSFSAVDLIKLAEYLECKIAFVEQGDIILKFDSEDLKERSYSKDKSSSPSGHARTSRSTPATPVKEIELEEKMMNKYKRHL